MTQVPALLTATEVAEALRVAPATVRRWAAENQIDHVRLPSGGLRFPAGVIQRPPVAVAERATAGSP